MPVLIRGDRLTEGQRRQVLAAYVYRWTHENARQTYRGGCPGCEQVGPFPYTCGEALPGGPVTYTREQWHAYHIPLVTDAEWLAAHSFWFLNDGSRLDGNVNHCEPAFMAEPTTGGRS